MFRAANSTGALPMLAETPSWLPVDQAGKAVAEIVTSHDENPAAVYHVLNPQMSKWQDILDGLSAGGLKYAAVDRTEWLDKLAQSDADVEKNPSYKLLVRSEIVQGRAALTSRAFIRTV